MQDVALAAAVATGSSHINPYHRKLKIYQVDVFWLNRPSTFSASWRMGSPHSMANRIWDDWSQRLAFRQPNSTRQPAPRRLCLYASPCAGPHAAPLRRYCVKMSVTTKTQLAHFRSSPGEHRTARYEKKPNVHNIVARLLLLTALSKRATSIHTARKRRMHKLIVHLPPIPLSRHLFSGDNPCPFDSRYSLRDLGEALKSERAKRHLLARFRHDVCRRLRVKRGQHGPSMLMYLHFVSI
jgi:hypothetical protein